MPAFLKRLLNKLRCVLSGRHTMVGWGVYDILDGDKLVGFVTPINCKFCGKKQEVVTWFSFEEYDDSNVIPFENYRSEKAGQRPELPA